MKTRTSGSDLLADRPAHAAATAPRPLRRPGAASLLVRAALPCFAALLAAGGCQTTVTDATPGGRHSPTQRSVALERPKPAARETPADRTVTTSSKGAQPAREALEPCAERLHDVCGALLIYYIQNRQLPPTLQALQDIQDGPDPVPPLVCPESRKPYAYIPTTPIPIDNPAGHIILHDAVAGHDGTRWCIVVSAGSSANEPMIVKAIGIKEDRFAVLRSRSLAADGQGK